MQDTMMIEVQDPFGNTLGEDQLRSSKVDKHEFLLPENYVVNEVLGKGAYGVVVSAYDEKKKKEVAIKKNCDIFTRNGNTLIPLRVLRELWILSHLSHPNLISLEDVVKPPSYETFNDLYLVTDIMETDLRGIIKSSQVLTDEHIKYITFQLLAAINYVHSASILHRDLKPENILINSDCSIKLCDFGLARGIDFCKLIDVINSLVNDPTMSTVYVMTRWYRAPELLLACDTVSCSADIWSVGCIVAELLLRRPVFKGTSPINQIEKIIDVLGTPPVDSIRGSRQGKEFMRKMYNRTSRFHQTFAGCNPEAVDLLQKLLDFNPDTRISAKEALKHPYLEDFYDEEVIFECPAKFDHGRDRDLKSMEQIKQATYQTLTTGYVPQMFKPFERPVEPSLTKKKSIFDSIQKAFRMSKSEV